MSKSLRSNYFKKLCTAKIQKRFDLQTNDLKDFLFNYN